MRLNFNALAGVSCTSTYNKERLQYLLSHVCILVTIKKCEEKNAFICFGSHMFSYSFQNSMHAKH